MKVFPHNFNPHSNSGPNKFTRQLFKRLNNDFGVISTNSQQDADVEFCLIQQQLHKVKPMLLRLDGIYFNSDQDYITQNGPIEYSYHNADAVIYQSEFNKRLVEHWFGTHRNGRVIHNGADTEFIDSIRVDNFLSLYDDIEEIWCSASSWRPHKRLNDNVRYFKEKAPEDAIMFIAGGAHVSCSSHKRLP